jgi:carboxymethylenebutenolidase
MTATADITLDTDDGPMPTHEARPEGDARGAVVVIQEAFGVTEHIQRVAQRLADAGWYAVAPALFHRQGSPVLAYDDFDAVMPVMGQITAGGLTTDLAAAFEHVQSEGFDLKNAGIVGFCMGGSVAFYAGTLHALGGAVTFYGGGISAGRFGLPALAEMAHTLSTPWLGLYGDQDQGISVEDVERLRQAAAGAPVPTEIVRYPEAQHGFNCEDRPNNYNAEAAADGWARTLAWFDRYVAG